MTDSLASRLCEALPEIVFLLDPAGTIRLCNSRAARSLGRAVPDLSGRPLLDFVAEEPAAARAYLRRCAGSGAPLPGVLCLRAGEGGRVLLQMRGSTVRTDEGTRLTFLRGVERQHASQVFLDLNARLARLADELHRRRRLQIELQQAVEDREVLLREVHHRVRNNLQVITSFLSLQGREVESESARVALREAQARIRTLGLIHGQLYGEAHFSEVDFGTLVPALCPQLAAVYGSAPDQIRFEVTLPSRVIELNRAVPLALLVTEAVTNSLKHAFPDGRTGTVRIDLEQGEDGAILRIGDDGVGLPEHSHSATRGPLGMRLMAALADQAGVRLEIRSERGVEVRIAIVED